MLLPTSETDFALGLEQSETILWENGYPGRWLAVGRSDENNVGGFAVAYSFGGRSDSSKNRTAILEGSAIRLVAPGMTAEDMAQIPDAPLIFYPAIDTKDGVFVVSNGAQTRPILDSIVEGASLEEAVTNAPIVQGKMNGEEVEIDLSSYEPDKPINTPRITGLIDLRKEAITPFGLAVVRKNMDTGEPIRSFYTAGLEDIEPGQGWAIQTYGWNDPNDREKQVPHFDRAPYGFSMSGSIGNIADRVRQSIGGKTFAAAVVRAIDVGSRQFKGHTIINTRG